MIKTVFLFHRFGPYHHARLRAIKGDVEVVGVELSAQDATYAWSAEAPAQSFRQVTLFRERDALHENGAEIIHRVTTALEDIRPAVVAVPGWSARASLAALGWCRRRRVPAVMMSESSALDGPRVWWKEAVKRRVVRACQAGLVGGVPHRDYLARLGMPVERIFLGYDAIDNAHFQCGAARARARAEHVRRQLGLPACFFLASNRFIVKKNLPVLLRAYARYHAGAGPAPWKLVLLGDGPAHAELEQLRAELGLHEAVLMPGFKQYDELPAYYGLAQAFVHASTVEPWGLVVNEAMAAGLPVIVSRRCGCAADLVRADVNGWLFDPLDEEKLASLLAKVACLPGDQRTALGNASQRMIADWGLETFASNAARAVQAARRVPLREPGLQERVLLRSLVHLGESS